MNIVYTKLRPSARYLEEIEEYRKLISEYKEVNTWTNPKSGKILVNYPEITTDRRCDIRKTKEENPNSYASRLFKILEGNIYFYTLNLCDIFSSWGEYNSIFRPDKRNRIKIHIDKSIKGAYIAKMELSSYSGAHIHIISGKQHYRHLKAETEVYDEFGLVEYLSKPVINPKEKYQDLNEYETMIGAYLYHKKQGIRLPRRSWSRLKA